MPYCLLTPCVLTLVWESVSETVMRLSKNVCVTFRYNKSFDWSATVVDLSVVSWDTLIQKFQGSIMGSQCEFLKLKLFALSKKSTSTFNARVQSEAAIAKGLIWTSTNGRSCKSSIRIIWIPSNEADSYGNVSKARKGHIIWRKTNLLILWTWQ